jgi:hypothetical protein
MIPLSAKPISLDSPFNVEIGSAFLERVENSKKKKSVFVSLFVSKKQISLLGLKILYFFEISYYRCQNT